jgi:hypothetical protein
MAHAPTAAEERWSSARGLLTLWTALALGPVVWAARFTAAYVLAGTACTGWGLFAMAVLTVVAIALSLLGAWLGWGIWNDVGAGPEAAGGILGRTRFLAISAVVFGLGFAFITAVEAIPLFMLEPCRS